MSQLSKYTIHELKVKDFAHLMNNAGYSATQLKSEVRAADLSFDKREVLLQRVDYALERINKPLDLWEMALFVILPYGKISNLFENPFFNAKEQLRLGFKTKVNQYRNYSMIGVIMYLLIFLSSIIYFQL